MVESNKSRERFPGRELSDVLTCYLCSFGPIIPTETNLALSCLGEFFQEG